jgi:4-amino-4-deoxy-L-arabinose transferase-like glycosyltransferase
MMRARSHSLSLIGLILLLLLSSGLKLVHLRADAPRLFPNGFESSDPVKDEAAKSYEARNRALFGAWVTSPADDYRYWNTLSPAWTHSLWLWFKLCGVSYPALRLFSVLWAALGIFAVGRFFPAQKNALAGPLAAILFAFNFYLLIYGRLGLMETALNTALLGSVMLLVRAEDRPGLFPLAGLIFFFAYLIKQSAAAFLPVLALAALLAPSGRRRFGMITLAMVILALAALFLWPDYWLRSVMNFRHALGWQPDASHRWMRFELPVTGRALSQAFGFTGLVRGYVLMLPMAGPLALLEIIIFLYRWAKTRTGERAEALLIAWLLCARAALAFSPHTVVRFYLIQFPPVCLLAGLLLERILRTAAPGTHDFRGAADLRGAADPSRAQRRLAVAALIVLSLIFDLVPFLGWLRSPSYQIRDAGQALHKALGPGPAVLIGEWAGPLCLESPDRTFYVKNIFNRRPEQLMQFGITHLLYSDPDQDPAIKSFRKALPGPFEKRRLILTLPLFNDQLSLFRVEVPQGSARP